MLRAVSAGAAFLLFLGGRRVGNAGMSVFSVFVRGLRAAKGVWRFFGVLLRIARGKGVLSKPCGTAARAVRGSCEAVRLFRSLRGRCAAKAGLLCFAVYLRGRPMGIRVFGAPLRELPRETGPYRGSSVLRSARGRELAARNRHIFFFYAFLLISFFPCAILK